VISENEAEDKIIQWLRNDSVRLQALKVAAELNLPQAYLAAGFVRNLVWDNLYRAGELTPLNDIDLIYFNADNIEPDFDRECETKLKAIIDLPWSVKNQARMHVRNKDMPYASTADAISYWTETETAVAARYNLTTEQIEIVSSFGVACLFGATITLNPKRPKVDDFYQRIENKNWLTQWPELKVVT